LDQDCGSKGDQGRRQQLFVTLTGHPASSSLFVQVARPSNAESPEPAKSFVPRSLGPEQDGVPQRTEDISDRYPSQCLAENDFPLGSAAGIFWRTLIYKELEQFVPQSGRNGFLPLTPTDYVPLTGLHYGA
jgi:hypothetical protein